MRTLEIQPAQIISGQDQAPFMLKLPRLGFEQRPRIHAVGGCGPRRGAAAEGGDRSPRSGPPVFAAFHLKRAVAVFRKQGVTVVPVGCDFHDNGKPCTWNLFPSQDRFALWSLYLHEKIGWWVYRWRGWI
jgi:hypothetical protein